MFLLSSHHPSRGEHHFIAHCVHREIGTTGRKHETYRDMLEQQRVTAGALIMLGAIGIHTRGRTDLEVVKKLQQLAHNEELSPQHRSFVLSGLALTLCEPSADTKERPDAAKIKVCPLHPRIVAHTAHLHSWPNTLPWKPTSWTPQTPSHCTCLL